MSAPMIHRSDEATRDEIADMIAELRAKAVRLSRHDPRRDAIDEECDALVDDWIAASG